MLINGMPLEDFLKQMKPEIYSTIFDTPFLREIVRSRQVQVIPGPMTFETKYTREPQTAEGERPYPNTVQVTIRTSYRFFSKENPLNARLR